MKNKKIYFVIPIYNEEKIIQKVINELIIKTKSLVIASILGSLAAACECEKDGNIEITPEQIIEKLNLIEDSSSYKIQR